MSPTENSEALAGKVLFCWSIKTSTTPPSIKRDIHIIFLGIPLIICIIITWRLRQNLIEDFSTWLMLCAPISLIFWIFIAIYKQKTVFKYIIHPDYGEVDHQLYYPDFAGSLFKSVAALTMLLFVGAALYTGSLLFLLGPAAAAVASALKLMAWEKPPVEKEISMPWHAHQFVTVDRKHLIIVVHTTDTTVGFKARFPDKALFEQYLAFLHTVVDPQAEFDEKIWKW